MHDAKKYILLFITAMSVTVYQKKDVFFLPQLPLTWSLLAPLEKKNINWNFYCQYKKIYLAQPWLSSSFDSPVPLIVILIARLLLATLWANWSPTGITHTQLLQVLQVMAATDNPYNQFVMHMEARISFFLDYSRFKEITGMTKVAICC